MFPDRQTATATAALCLFLTAVTGAAAPVGRDLVVNDRRDVDTLLRPAESSLERTDHEGRRLPAGALHDKVVVAAFVSVDCRIACVLRTLELDKVARVLPDALRERVAFLCIDTDPARDDVDRLRTFAAGLVGASSRLRFLPSDPAGTAALAAKLHYPADALPEPPPTILVFDRRGQVAMTYAGDPFDGPRLLRDVALLDTFDRGIGRPPGAVAEAASIPF